MIRLENYINNIDLNMRASKNQVWQNQAKTNKPLNSFGILENSGYRLSQIIGMNRKSINKRIIVFAADHGISRMNLSVFQQSHTMEVVKLLMSGKTPLNKIANKYHIPINCIDIGLNGCVDSEGGIVIKKVNNATNNIYYENAMSMQDVKKALEVGIEVAEQYSMEMVNIVALGEVGIGNTVSASALTAIMLDLESHDVTGRGTGIDREKLENKIEIVSAIIKRCNHLKSEPMALLEAAGGYEICGSAGFILGCAYHKIPVVIDGFITGVAALIAYCINPNTQRYLFASHQSAEPGHKHILKKLNLQPLIDLKMRYGLATGAAIALPLYETAYFLTNE